jgi:hypothetical protein
MQPSKRTDIYGGTLHGYREHCRPVNTMQQSDCQTAKNLLQVLLHNAHHLEKRPTPKVMPQVKITDELAIATLSCVSAAGDREEYKLAEYKFVSCECPNAGGSTYRFFKFRQNFAARCYPEDSEDVGRKHC